MKTTDRFEHALTKLYTAFHDGSLHPECAKSCAVGNICDNMDAWTHFSDHHGSTVLNYIGRVNEAFGRKINGYLPSELLQVEAAFLKGCGYVLPYHHRNYRPDNPTDKTVLFNGLSAAVALLCKLDGVSDVMDYSELFKFENDQDVYELSVS